MLDLLATGYPSLDHIIPATRVPNVGETALIADVADSERATYGGCGANVAVAMQRLGFATGLAMVIGDDDEGTRYGAYLMEQGIDCASVVQWAGSRTSRSYLFRAPDGEYVNFFHAGASDAWAGELQLSGVEHVRWGLVTVGYYPYNAAFVAQLARHNVPLIWQLKADIAAYPRAALEQFANASRIVCCNQLEADYLLRGLGMNSLAKLFALGIEIIVLTLGGAGSRVLTRAKETLVPTVPCNVVDTTGAGDAYTAGFLAGHFRGYQLPVCGRLGTVAAAFAVESIGCQTNLPTWEQLLARYEMNFGTL
jgi:sugar/nucleoside kinase (ribokinase family)